MTDCKPEEAYKIYKKYRSAVVGISSEIILTTLAAPGIPDSTNSTTQFLVGNGFFVRDHYIVCPAHLVTIPASQLATRNRYPYVSSSQPVPSGVTPNAITAVSRILVTVSNVNNKERSYVYLAKLIGVDGAGDIAYLEIDCKSAYNATNPKICKDHPRFKWGRSRQLTPGTKVYSYGDFTADNTSRVVPAAPFQPVPATKGFIAGTVSNNRALDYAGSAQQELLLVDFVVYAGKAGLPLIDQFGELVGMQTFNRNQGMVAGPTEFFMRRALKAFICATPKKSSGLVTIPDANGSYYSYVKAYLGLAWKAVNGLTLDTTIDQKTGISSVRIDAKTGELPTNPACKEIVGVQIIALAGDTSTTYVRVPGAAGAPAGPQPAVAGTVDSPFLGIILPGDIVTHIDGQAVGGEYHQIPPALFTWSSAPGRLVTLTYRKASDNFSSVNKALGASLSYPPMYDYAYATIADYVPAAPPNAFIISNFQQPF